MPLPKGYHHTKETIEKMRLVKLGHKVSKEAREKISKAFKGKTYEQIMGIKNAKERKEKLSNYFSGEGNPFYNQKHNEKTCQIMRLKRLGRTHEEIIGEENAKKWRERMSNVMKGENHWHWKGGTSYLPYTNDFSFPLRRYIKKRDNYTCLICSKHKCQINSRNKLSVHHIDLDKQNNIPPNLVTLCPSCHQKIHRHPNPISWKTFFQKLLSERFNYKYDPDGRAIINLEIENRI